jgi:hypothetical protein
LVAPIAEALTNEDLQVRDILGTPRIQPTVKSGELVETTKWEEGTLVYGFPGVHRASNDRYSFDVLNSILSGPGGVLKACVSNRARRSRLRAAAL